MQLTATQDIEAPRQQVFDLLSDVDAHLARLTARGVDVAHVSPPGAGALRAWRGTFDLRDKPREAVVRLTALEPPARMVFEWESGGLHGRTELNLEAPTEATTQATMDTTLLPQTLSARLLVQSLKLGRGKIENRIGERMAEAATEIEKRTRDAG
ncbi:SRPBCC family protein [Citreimonas sp.]|uniref:SRPBCC family protein n=1 Tax=Citreimonas sp. TaxID=3036715 RepID=UPI0035C7C4ED